MFIKSLTAAALAVAATFTAVPEAQARSCHNFTGYSVCFELIAKSGNLTKWGVGFANNHASEGLTVVCNGNYLHDWSSYGQLNHAEAQYIAASFCAL